MIFLCSVDEIWFIKIYSFPISQSHNHAQLLQLDNSGGPLDNQTWQTEWKTAPLSKAQLCEYENQTLEAFVATIHLYVQWPARITFIYCK